MSLKRKASGRASALSQKRSRRGVEENETEPHDVLDEGFVSEGSSYSDDPIVMFTDNGTKRADSEARRQWNYVCNVAGCRQRFNRPCRLEAHMRSHTKERPFACFYSGCSKTFPRKDHLQRHIKNSHPDTEIERSFLCDWEGCGKSFTSSGRLQRHKEVHESKFYCIGYPPCNEHFRKEKTLEAHIKAQHLDVKPYSCTYADAETGECCNRGYEAESNLRRHFEKAHANGKQKEDRHCCMICIPPGTDFETITADSGIIVTIPKEPLLFVTKEELLAHTREHHPPICTKCGVRFGTSSNLKAHYETVHANPEDQPRFLCPQPECGKIFNRQHNLNVHIHCVHEKKARFFCTSDCIKNSKHTELNNWDGKNACGAAFKAKSSLDQHIRTHHLALPNRKATRKKAKANKAAPDPSMLTLLTGVGYEMERTVLCLVHDCEYRFFMDRDLRRHLRATHKWTDDQIEEKILEREALMGGQFWIGGLDDPMFDSTYTSIPQTPSAFHMDPALQSNGEVQKEMDPQLQLGLPDQPLEWSMIAAEEAEMDQAMGLDGFSNVDVLDGIVLDLLGPVAQFNR